MRSEQWESIWPMDVDEIDRTFLSDILPLTTKMFSVFAGLDSGKSLKRTRVGTGGWSGLIHSGFSDDVRTSQVRKGSSEATPPLQAKLQRSR